MFWSNTVCLYVRVHSTYVCFPVIRVGLAVHYLQA